MVDTHGEYLESPRRVAGEMNVPFIDLNKLTHDLVTGMGVENSRKLFMWIPAGQYEFCPEGKIDNTHLNIYWWTYSCRVGCGRFDGRSAGFGKICATL